MSTNAPIDRSSRVYISGHSGLVGSAIWRYLESQGFINLLGVSSGQLDLRDRPAVFSYFDAIRPDVVIDAAAKVGGIHANSTYPAEFLSDNLQIQLNVMDAANAHNVDRLLFLGSSCIYPRLAPQPIKEDSLLTGPLEPTNQAYAVAKIAGIMQVQAVRTQYGRRWISAMPTNLYGPGDNFHPQNAHVLPSLVRRFDAAARAGSPSVEVWGSGAPRREFLYVDDMASAALFLLENYDEPETINVGFGSDLSIAELAQLVAGTVGFEGRIVQDASKPDGTPQKLLDVSRMKALGWEASTSLADGLASTFEWFRQHHASLRNS